MTEQMYFPFHYGDEADSYTFYRIPKALFENPYLEKNLTTDAKLLYAILLDRLQLSIRNNFVDENGRAYIYFTVEQIMNILHCGNKKVSHLLAELDDRKGVGLITRIRQGQGKADRIYVHKCVRGMMGNAMDGTAYGSGGAVDDMKIDISDQRQISSQENDSAVDEYLYYQEYFREQISYDVLTIDYPYEIDSLDEIVDLLVETACTRKKTVRIGGEDKPASVVNAKFRKLDSEHIRYVMSSLQENTTDVKNIRQYLLTSLYNAPSTISHYYRAKVNYDMYGNHG